MGTIWLNKNTQDEVDEIVGGTFIIKNSNGYTPGISGDVLGALSWDYKVKMLIKIIKKSKKV